MTIRLTYISTARPGADDECIDAILAASRRNNGTAGITGLLLFDGKRFLQALEGDPASVERVYARIKADPRHFACVQLDSRVIAERAFDGWAMACQRVGDRGEGATLAETVERLVTDVADASTRALFTSFARIERPAA